jgi:NDP-sugar pyrophosphorylase family protein
MLNSIYEKVSGANVPIEKLTKFHQRHGKLATVTTVRPPARFGHLEIKNSQVIHFGGGIKVLLVGLMEAFSYWNLRF